MKKKFLQKQRGILVALLGFLCVISINAQTWTAPTLTGSTPVSGTTYYMYNVGSNGYLTRGAYYSTQAAVSAQPRLNAKTSVIKWTVTNTTGSMWSFQYNLDGADQTDWFLCATDPGNGDIYVDAWDVTNRAPNRPWTVALTDPTNKIYSIQVRGDYGGYNATQYLGTSSSTEGTGTGIANTAKYNRAGGDGYTQWKFVSQADLDLYNARILLDKYMTYAKNKAMDVSSYITIYDAGVTATITTAAGELLTALGRTDVTASIINPSFESSFTGWTNNGFANPSNDPNATGMTKVGTYYCEKFTSAGEWWANNLTAGTLTQTVSGLSSGMYELVVSGHAVQQVGANPLHTGAYITAGSQRTEVVAGQDYSISNILVTGTTLTIGYSLVAPIACNWTGFDNFRLYYYGAAVVPSLGTSKTQFAFNGSEGYISDSLTVTGGNLSGAISISAPAGITVNPTSLPSGASNATVIVTYDNSTAVSGNITFTSGTTTANVAVAGAPGADCFTPLYPTGNLITDSRCNSYLANGWGGKSINTNPTYVYCGSSSVYINGGSCDRALNGTNGNAQMLPNTNYRVKAKVWKVSGANVGVGVYGWSSGQPDIYHAVTTTGSWQDIDFTFTSGATLGGSQGLFFNDGVGYIDNWEMYVVLPQLASQAEKDALNARITAATDLLNTTPEGDAPGKYTTANRTILQNLITSSTTLYNNSSALDVEVNNASSDLASAMLTYQNSRNSVIVTDDAADPYRLVSGFYLIRLKGTDLYLTAPSVRGVDGGNGEGNQYRTSYQTLRDKNVQNCQKWNIQYNSVLPDPVRYSFVSGIDGATNWTESDATVVGHLDDAGRFRDGNTVYSQADPYGKFHNYTVRYDGTAFGLWNVGANRSLNLSATVSGETVTTTYAWNNTVEYLYDFIAAPNLVDALNNNAMVNKVTTFVRDNKVVSNFNLDAATEVSISLYNMNGMLIESSKSIGQSGKNERVMNTPLSAGAYMVRTSIDGKFTVSKIIL